MSGLAKEPETSFAVVAIPKLFFFDGRSVTAVVDAVAASAGVVDIAEKFERFLAKEYGAVSTPKIKVQLDDMMVDILNTLLCLQDTMVWPHN